ncbi:MAG: NB-ARC domain-containing protein [Cyanobacteria bacterium P01_B01_bin.77]
MTSGKPKRRRGIVLTLQGERKLRAVITHVETEECFGQKLTLEELSDRTSLDAGTVAKVLDCEQGVDRRTLQRFFRAFELELVEGDTCKPEFRQTQPASISIGPSQTAQAQVDWGEAVDVSIFYGRTSELATLEQWILDDHCRLIALLGMGGIGKTALSVKLSENIQSEFDYLIWRSLREAPPVEKILVDLLKFLSDQQETELANTVGESVTRLIHYLQQSRCLLVLDNVESILQGGVRAGQYREGYEGYSTLIQRLGESRHQSCLLLTSREKPKEIARQEGKKRMVRSLELKGLEDHAGQEFLKAEGLDDTNVQWKNILDYYSGNPLALKIAANTIQDLFGGDVDTFIRQEGRIFGDIRDLLEQQFERLSEIGKSVMYWLSINRESTLLEELKEDILDSISSQKLLEILESLRRRSLVERTDNGFTLQNVVMEYVTEHFVSQISEQLEAQNFVLFNGHALMKAMAKDYVRETQVRLILSPISSRIKNLGQQVNTYLETVRQHSDLSNGYAAGNLLNLLCQTRSEIFDFDFSALTLRQVYLKGMQLHSVKLAQTFFIQLSLTHNFSKIYTVAFSADGKKLATGDGNNQVQLWNIRNRQHSFMLREHTHRVRAVAFSPDGQFLASGSEDATIRLWDIQQRQCLYVFNEHTNDIRSLAFSPDGQFLASGSADATIRLWDIQQRQCLYVFKGHTNWIRSLAFSPNGQFLVSASEDATVRLWNIQQRQCCHVFGGYSKKQFQQMWSVAFSPDGQLLASGGADSTIQLWDIQQRQCLLVFRKHTKGIRSLVFTPDSQFLLSGSEDSTIRLWDIQQRRCCHVFEGHTNDIRSLALNPDGKLLASGSADSTIRLWDIQQRRCFYGFAGFTNWVRSVALSSDGRFLASGREDSSIRLWDLQKRRCIYTFTGHTNDVGAVAFSPDGHFLASGSGDNTIRIWDLQKRQCLYVFAGHTNDVRTVVFSANSKVLASGSEDFTIRLWDLQKRECLCTLKGHEHWVWSVIFSPDGRFLASGSSDSTIRLWDIQQQQCCYVFKEHTNWVGSVVFSPDSRFLASGSKDSTIRLWCTQSKRCLNLLQGHTSWVQSVAFSPKAPILASGSEDLTVRLWHIESGKCLHTLQGHTSWVRSVAFSPDGQILVSGSNDGTIRLWNVETGECVDVLRAPRPYEGTNITGIRGLTDAQLASMLALGAVDSSESNCQEI